MEIYNMNKYIIAEIWAGQIKLIKLQWCVQKYGQITGLYYMIKN
jgi:hypothetical protein